MKENNKKITLQEMKNLEIEILKQVDKICKENNLKYSLMDGSLIGAIRHKGFIPWDDDNDIMMPRPDYEKLKKIMINNPIDNLKYMSSDTQEDCYYPFAKIVSTKTSIKEHKAKEIKDYGVFIDVFPIDGVSNNKIKRYIQTRTVAMLRNLIRISSYEKQISENKMKKIIKKFLTIITQLIGTNRMTKKVQKLMKKYSYESSKYVTLIYNDISINKRKIYGKDIFEKISYKPFEDKEFCVIDDYDKYLTDLFGDYMTPPPSEKQKSNHNFDRLEWKN